MTTGAATSELRCSGSASAKQYAARAIHRRSPVRPAASAATIETSVKPSEAAYTSVSVAFCQTDDVAPAAIAAAKPAAREPVARPTNQALKPPANAVDAAEKRFVATANGRNARIRAHVLSMRMNSGVPGGCGMPSE